MFDLTYILEQISSFSWIVSIAAYLLTAFGLYKMAKNMGLSSPWISFIPIANIYALGRIAEKYVKMDGRPSAKFSKILLTLYIILCVLAVALLVLIFVFIIVEAVSDPSVDAFLNSDAIAASLGVTFVLPLLLICFGIIGVAIAYAVVFYVALWRIFAIYDDNATLYLVLSIVFGFLYPIFLFILRNRQPNIVGYVPEENVM